MNREQLIKEANKLLKGNKPKKAKQKKQAHTPKIQTRKDKKNAASTLSAKAFNRVHSNLIEKRKNAEQSPFETQVEAILKATAVEYTKEQHFHKMINPATGNPLFIDFYIDSLKLAIEVDGGHHRFAVNGKEALKSQKERDRAKDNYCRSNGIYVLRLSTAKSTRFEQRIFEAIQQRLERINKPKQEPKKPIQPVKHMYIKHHQTKKERLKRRIKTEITIDDYNALAGCGHRLTNRVIAEIK